MAELAEDACEDARATLRNWNRSCSAAAATRPGTTTATYLLEVRAGTGGAEAALFAGDLLRMYLRYAERRRWQTEMISEPGELGGYKEVVVRIIGATSVPRLKFESGAHRVQRVPETEAQGRIHTSARTVAMLPEAEAVDGSISIPRPAHRHLPLVRCRRAARQHHGFGGAHHPSAHRHRRRVPGRTLATQEQGACDVAAAITPAGRCRRQRRAQSRRGPSPAGRQRRPLERIRTYNFPQNRLTDHRINLTLYKLDEIMEALWTRSSIPAHEYQAEQLAALGAE